MTKIPTKEEYEKAKEIVDLYKAEKRRIHGEKLEKIRIDLEKYFSENLVEGRRVKSFSFSFDTFSSETVRIIPDCFDEDYSGSANEDIKKIGEKYDIDLKFIYWVYGK